MISSFTHSAVTLVQVVMAVLSGMFSSDTDIKHFLLRHMFIYFIDRCVCVSLLICLGWLTADCVLRFSPKGGEGERFLGDTGDKITSYKEEGPKIKSGSQEDELLLDVM